MMAKLNRSKICNTGLSEPAARTEVQPRTNDRKLTEKMRMNRSTDPASRFSHKMLLGSGAGSTCRAYQPLRNLMGGGCQNLPHLCYTGQPQNTHQHKVQRTRMMIPQSLERSSSSSPRVERLCRHIHSSRPSGLHVAQAGAAIILVTPRTTMSHPELALPFLASPLVS